MSVVGPQASFALDFLILVNEKFKHYQNPTVSSRTLLSGNRGSIYQRRKQCFVEHMMPVHIARRVGYSPYRWPLHTLP